MVKAVKDTEKSTLAVAKDSVLSLYKDPNRRKVATNLLLFGFGVMIARESGDLWEVLMGM